MRRGWRWQNGQGRENPLWETMWASESFSFDGIQEHVVTCLYEIYTSLTPLSNLCFICFINSIIIIKWKKTKTHRVQHNGIEIIGVSKRSSGVHNAEDRQYWSLGNFLPFWAYDATNLFQISWSMRAKLSLLNINPKFLVLNSYILDTQILLVHIKNSMHFTYTVIKKFMRSLTYVAFCINLFQMNLILLI